MVAPLNTTVLHGTDWTFFRLGGVMETGSIPTDLLGQITGALLLVDLSGIERVEPAGISHWQTWLGDARPGRRVVLVNCSQSVVGQLRLSPHFADGTSVMSVIAPYYCETCDDERPSALVLRNLPTPLVAPPARCKVCGGETDFDDIEATWFAFLDRVPATEPDASIEQALAEARAMLGEGPPPEPRPKAALGAETERIDQIVIEKTTTPWDIGFWVAVGILLAVFSLVVVQLASH